MDGFDTLQERLPAVWAVNRAGVEDEHVLVVLPSYSVGETLLAHYDERLPALEHRYLLAYLLLGRIPGCEMVYVTCRAPAPEVVDYYTSLLPPDRRASARNRFRAVEVPDETGRSVAAKLLDRPDLLDELRRVIAGRPALIEAWNVTDREVEVALQLGAPINGTSPRLRPLAYKSAGRRLFAEAGVPTALGAEDVRTVDDVVTAVAKLRAARPGLRGVVVKHDDSGAGDGNVVLDLTRVPDGPAGDEAVRGLVEALPGWYLEDLAGGGVVEELVCGARFTSPSVQLDVDPAGEVTVLATHEQVLGGESGQVYTGCRFPADPAYAPELARHGRAVGEALARLGARGRMSVDFAAACDEAGGWRVYALEVNLRKGGTTHPYSVLRNLAPGRYDVEAGQWRADLDGRPRAYRASDNLVDDAWCGLPAREAIAAVADAGLQFDCATGVGVVLHMLSGLAIDGRLGLTAVGHDPGHAEDLYERARAAIDDCRIRPAR